MRLMALLTLALAAFHPVSAADPSQQKIDFISAQIGVLGLPLSENQEPTYRIALSGEVSEHGQGRCTLVLDLTAPPTYDEFGFMTVAAPAREVKLDCTINRVKTTTKVFTVRVGGPGSDEYEEYREEWSLYAISGPLITSPLFLALLPNSPYPHGRFIVQDKHGNVKYVVDLMLPPQPEPCHPGCFPPGTAVSISGGSTPIEEVRQGDTITTVAGDGRAGTAQVEHVFVTRNRLLEVRTEGGTLVTTETQPLALEEGGYRAAGELQTGDRVWRWDGAKRRASAVLGVSLTARESRVFNLVLGVPTTFIAGDFLARSKPPVDVVSP